jgi:hypothetical protein
VTDILAAIDAAIGCQHCDAPLAGSVSDDFCGQACQHAWHAARTEQLAGYREPWDRPAEFPGLGHDRWVSTAWRLPRSTGDRAADLRAARHALVMATTDEQLAAVAVRMESLRDRQAAAARATWEQLRPGIEALVELGRELFAGFAEGIRQVGEALAPVLAEFGKTRGLQAQRPDDRWERALQARRTRNTGPARRQRPPLRIDARRAR